MKPVVTLFLGLLAGCGGAPFTNLDSPQASDGGVALETGAEPHDSGAGTLDQRVVPLEASRDAGDRRDAGTVPDDGGAVQDGQVGDAPSDCANDLSNIGTSNFHIAFDLLATSTESDGPLVEQRATCNQYDVHWLVAASSGHLVAQTYDGSAGATLQSIATITDGARHHVVVARVSGTLSISIDGAIDSSEPSAVFAPGTLPLLQVGRSACASPFPGQVTNVCIARP